MITDGFRGDLKFFEKKLKRKEPFSLTRFGDGERDVMDGKHLFLSQSKQEFDFSGEEHLRKDLIESFKLIKKNYFIGIPCPCCQPQAVCNKMKEASGQPNENLTWANIFVNGNYSYFISNTVPLFNLYKTTIICSGNTEKLKFNFYKHHKIGINAWVQNSDLYENIRNQIINNDCNNELFLFCAGPFANILCSKLYQEFPSNTFLDIGSVFNLDLGIGANRGYLKGAKTLTKNCIW
jgi:hypothetical protein|tara:strand:+ start:13096 stop:13803 length:708 start_codon:yes stop_codon:yes gene_type:complete